MDEITVLRDGWGDVDQASPGAPERARAALMNRIAQASEPAAMASPPPTQARPLWERLGARLRPGRAWRLGIAALAVTGVGLAVVVNPDSPGGAGGQATVPREHAGSAAPSADPATVDTAGQTLELAAQYAAARPFTAPRPNQWAYVELKISVPDSHGVLGLSTVRKSWFRLDGRKIAIPSGGNYQITDFKPMKGFDPHYYPALADLPTDPQAVLALLGTFNHDPDPSRQNVNLFGLIGYVLRENVLPPASTATLLRTAALIPGVTQDPGTVPVDGRAAIAIGVSAGPTREQILLDPATNEFVGSRGVATGETITIHVERSDGRTLPQASASGMPPTQKGAVQFLITRGVCGIVDRPGRLP